MSGSRPSFLARLSPAVSRGASAVRPALPARFAPAEPAPLVDRHMELSADSGFSGFRDDGVALERIDEHQGPAPSVRPMTMGAVARADSEQSQSRPPAPSVNGESEMPAAVEPAAPRAVPTAAPEGGGPVPERGDSLSVPPAAPPIARQATPGKSAPLQNGTIMQRALGTRAAQPSVVQVTIDRIDLRMPSEKAAERKVEQRRPSRPAMSLSDYLRGRG